MASTPTILAPADPRSEDFRILHDLLIAFNRGNAVAPDFKPVALLLKSESGETVGGLWGRTAYDWLFVEVLIVPESLRHTGLGTALMRQAEQIASERNCVGVWLDTFSFQARPFYEKLGYTVFAELKDRPRGVSQFWLQKRFDGGSI